MYDNTTQHFTKCLVQKMQFMAINTFIIADSALREILAYISLINESQSSVNSQKRKGNC